MRRWTWITELACPRGVMVTRRQLAPTETHPRARNCSGSVSNSEIGLHHLVFDSQARPLICANPVVNQGVRPTIMRCSCQIQAANIILAIRLPIRSDGTFGVARFGQGNNP